MTKFPIAKSLPSKEVINTFNLIKNDIISMLGVPKIIKSDRGSEFKNSSMKSVKGTGLVEIMNRTKKRRIVEIS